MDSERFAFTVMFVEQGEWTFAQIRLYTYGYPLDALSPLHAQTISSPMTIYPNPFAASFRLDLQNYRPEAIELYDLLGRLVWSKPIAPGVRQVNVVDRTLMFLPSGAYYLILKGAPNAAPIQIIHLK